MEMTSTTRVQGAGHLATLTAGVQAGTKSKMIMEIQPYTKNRIDRRGQQGFTQAEMLLVLVILATLAAIVYPKVMGRSDQARITAAQTQLAHFNTALDAYELDNPQS